MTHRSRITRVRVTAVLIVALVVVGGSFAYLYLQSRQQQDRGDMLEAYGKVSDLSYQGTTISIVFTSNTRISLYSASISYTANNHANSEQSYKTAQLPLGSLPVYLLQRGDALKIQFADIPAGSLLLDIDVQVNASVGSGSILLMYKVAQLETNSSSSSPAQG